MLNANTRPATPWSRSKRWCFTKHWEGDIDDMPMPVWVPSVTEYMIWQVEVGTGTGRPHVQGYVRFKTDKKLADVKNILFDDENDDVHLAMARGNEQQNKEYCSKEGAGGRMLGFDVMEYGKFDPKAGTQGRRSDLEDVTDLIVQGASMRDVASEHPASYVRYHQGLEKFQRVVAEEPPRERTVTVWVWWGPTGTGKTHRAMTNFPDIYGVVPGRDPWAGYSGQAEVLWDEFDYSKWSIQEMNRYLDKWKLQLDRRYLNVHAAWSLVILCSNSRPESWWPEQANSLLMNAFLRRISRTTYVADQQQEVDMTR